MFQVIYKHVLVLLDLDKRMTDFLHDECESMTAIEWIKENAYKFERRMKYKK